MKILSERKNTIDLLEGVGSRQDLAIFVKSLEKDLKKEREQNERGQIF